MSTTPRFIAVLDVGKTNVKLVVHDLESGEDVFVRTRPNAVVDLPPYPHYDVEGMWTFFLDTLKDADIGNGIAGAEEIGEAQAAGMQPQTRPNV